MAEVLLFHHAQGLTPGVRAFADELRAAGHTVHAPDLFDGRTFASIEAGMAFIEETGSSRPPGMARNRYREGVASGLWMACARFLGSLATPPASRTWIPSGSRTSARLRGRS